MIRQKFTPERINRVQFSLQKMAILSQMLLIENVNELDIDFKIPFINNFAKRIGKDCKAIQDHVAASEWTGDVKNNDNLEEYSSELWRIVDLLSGLDINIIREHADYLGSQFKRIEA